VYSDASLKIFTIRCWIEKNIIDQKAGGAGIPQLAVFLISIL
jgi:hypothetical protein